MTLEERERGEQKDRRGEGGHKDNRKMRRRCEKAGRKSDRRGERTGQDWRMGEVVKRK